MSTVRAFSNNKRVSTGKPMNNGSFFQAYPSHHVFASQDEWMNHWKTTSNATFVKEGCEGKPSLIPATATSPPLKNVIAKEKNMGPMSKEQRSRLVEMLHASITNVVDEWCRLSGFDDSTPSSPPRAPASSTTNVAVTPPPKSTPVSPPPLMRKVPTKPRMEDWSFAKKYSFVAPPGTYYIGDLCYFLKEPMYDTIYGGREYESGIYTHNNNDDAFFMVDNTAYGDGAYIGSDGFEYGVDAGIIGIASRSLGPEADDDVYGGKLHTFKDPIEIKFKNGVFRFWSRSKYLAIDTAGNTYNSDTDW